MTDDRPTNKLTNDGLLMMMMTDPMTDDRPMTD
jgi:hypothetical protein